MLHSQKNTVFSSAAHRASVIIENVRTIFETLDTQLLGALCNVNTEGKHDVRKKYPKWLWRKKSLLTRSIVIKLPVKPFLEHDRRHVVRLLRLYGECNQNKVAHKNKSCIPSIFICIFILSV